MGVSSYASLGITKGLKMSLVKTFEGTVVRPEAIFTSSSGTLL
jgi:hypothetical protein